MRADFLVHESDTAAVIRRRFARRFHVVFARSSRRRNRFARHCDSPSELCLRMCCPSCCATARALKEQYRPGVITYSRKVFLPLTNLCRDYCSYCTYRRDPGQPGAHTMSPDEVLAVARQGEKLGCTEALFSLGDKPKQHFPRCANCCASAAIAVRCITSRPCATWCCVRLRSCRTPIPG